MNYYAVNTSPSLSHYGILGMKWGVRRFENPDGTLTAAGKARYGTSERFHESDYYKKYQAKKKSKSGKVETINSNTSNSQKLTPEEVAAKNRKATAKVAGVALGITAAAAVIGYMAAKHSVDKKAVDAGKEMVERIKIDKIPVNTIKVDKVVPNYVNPDSYLDRAKKASEGLKKAADNMNKSRDSFDKASVDLDLMNKFFTTDMSTDELFRRMRK